MANRVRPGHADTRSLILERAFIIAGCFLVAATTAGRAQSRPGAVTAASVPPPARANADSVSQRELQAILNELDAAILHHDAAVVEKYYSQDYVMTFRDGRRGDFQNSLHVLTDTSRNQWQRHDRSDERLLFYGPTAIATFTVHSQWVARASQKQFDVRESVTQTWIRRDGRWTLIATHVSPIDSNPQ